MKASILDLRYKMKDVQQALRRNEEVKITYHGKLIGTISSCSHERAVKVANHPFFGMLSSEKAAVDDTMQQLRGGRVNDL